MSLLPFFEWMENLGFSVFLRDSSYISPFINVAHIVSLVTLAGALLVVDIHLLGGGLRKQPLAQVAREARPWLIGALLMMVATGLPQLVSTAMKQYYSDFFWTKMETLLVAVIFTFTIRRRVTTATEAVRPVWAKLVGLTSIVLWGGVAVQGRLIGLL
jgi:hypothetical protein